MADGGEPHQEFQPDVAVLGARRRRAARGLHDGPGGGAGVRGHDECARLRILAVDSRKFGRTALVRYAEWSNIDRLVTDEAVRRRRLDRRCWLKKALWPHVDVRSGRGHAPGEELWQTRLALGIIGGGLMGREVASAIARWCALLDVKSGRSWWRCATRSRPRASGSRRTCRASSRRRPTTASCWPTRRCRRSTAPCRITCTSSSTSTSSAPASTCWARSRLASTWPANEAILAEARKHPGVVVRCSSEFPFFPAVQRIVARGAAGTVRAASSKSSAASCTART